MRNFKLALAQFSPHVGNIEQNATRIAEQAQQAQQQGADIIVFPELSLIGYPAEDLILRKSIAQRTLDALEQLKKIKDILIIVGAVESTSAGQLHNAAVLIKNGEILATYRKQNLPNYSVFDEKRYFTTGSQHLIFEHAGHKFGVLICEDVWTEETVKQVAKLGAKTLLVLNASPYEAGKQDVRRDLLKRMATKFNMNIAYVNQLGGQDDLIFDGCSMLMNADGELAATASLANEQLLMVEYQHEQQKYAIQTISRVTDAVAEIYQLLVMSVRDYVNRSKFPGVILGLSGGIDSALTLAIAVDALGANRVQAVMMPYQYTAKISIEDATAQANALGVTFAVAEIHPIVSGFLQTLHPFFGNGPADTTEENLQARARGTMLMALSNKFGNLVLATGNKSELAVGYCTLYGDMVGGFAPLKDVYKSIVFELAKYRNSLSETPVIPERVITRPPSAELRPDQKDQDSLPPYDILDGILYMYIEENMSQDEIIAKGFDAEVVKKVIGLTDRNEYKRRQGAIGPRISAKAFGRDRRYPIINGWTAGK
ncbi:NAD+ synthase [Acinetobacter sp. c1-l78]|uniref:NAD+ synthase n=1 Tax=Acinetobacter sp. c1-l78 TaxID=3342803 RepID=UPI0035BAB7DB